MKQLSVKRKIMLLVLILLLGIKVMSCDGGLDIGSMLGCEDSEGMRTLNWGEYPPDDKMYNLGMLRVTQPGFDYLSTNGLSLVEAAMGGSLAIPMDETPLEVFGMTVCTLCQGGCNIPINISTIMFEPTSYNQIKVTVSLPATTATNPWLTIPASCCQSGITVFTGTSPLDIPVIIDVSTDHDTGYLVLDVIMPDDTEMNNIIDSLNFGLCGLGTEAIKLVKNAFKNLIKGMLEDLIKDQITQFSCVSCDETKPCPTHPSGAPIECRDGLCYLGDEACLPMPLGLEAEVDLGALVADFVPGMESKIWASLVLGGETEVVANGFNFGIFGGTMVPPDAEESCAGFEEYPPVADGLTHLEFLSTSNVNEHVNPYAPYHLGIGLREELLDQVGYTINNSGLLCMALDQNTPEIGTYVGPGIFGLLLSDINLYTGGGNIAWQLALEPGPPIDFQILDSETAYPDEAPGFVDAALKIKLRDLGLNFYGLVEGRLVRMFTLRVDADVLAGVDIQGNKLEVQLGDGAINIGNYRLSYSIDSTPPEDGANKFADLIGGILDGMLGDLLSLDPIEIPGFDINGDDIEDLYINIQSVAPESEKSNTGEYRGLYIYAALENAGSKKSAFMAETRADLVDSFMPTRNQYVIDGIKPSLTLNLSGTDADGGDRYLEYSISTDNGKKWSPFRSDNEVIIDSNILLLEGEHSILVRSRDKRDKTSIDSTPEAFVFTTDFTEPTLRMMRENGKVKLIGKDNISDASSLLYRVKVNDERWSDWSENNMFDLNTVRSFPATVQVQVQDEAGLVTEMSKTYKGREVEIFSVREPRAIDTEAHASVQNSVLNSEALGAGCSSSSASNGWLLLLLMVPLAFIRRMSTAKAMMLPFALVLTVGLFACSGNNADPDECVTDADCTEDGYVCENNHCVEGNHDGDTDNDFNMPDGDEDDDVIESEEKEAEEEPDTFPCNDDGTCPTCFRCKSSTNMCVLNYCDPECDDPRVPVCSDTDTCSYCDTSKPVYECKMVYCDMDEPDSCSCRQCDGGAQPVCQVGGICACEEPCQCDEGQACCTLENPAGDCMDCPGWCEGVECEPGYAPGGCSEDNVTVCSWWAGENPLWSLCSNYDDTTCEFSGVGLPDHAPSCTCAEMAPLPLAWHGSYSDMAIFNYENKDEMWVSAYNRTYGDLMVGRIEARSIGVQEIYWDFVDGVPDVPPNAAPSGPRGGVVDVGDDMGKHTSIALSSDGWPRIAYQDVENGDLVLIYTNGEAAVVDEPVDGDADEELEDAEDSEDVEAEAGEEETSARLKVDGDADDEVVEAETETDDAPAYDEYGKYRWYKVVVDQEGDTGYYTDIWIDENDRPVIVYMMKSNEAGSLSALKMAIASTDAPAAAEDFSIVTVDSAPIGTPYCAAGSGNCKDVIDTPFGLGINPVITGYTDGSSAGLMISYYHNTSYELTSVTDANGTVLQAYDNVKYGNLKLASLDGLPDASTTTSGSFSVENWVGHSGSLANGDVGEFHSVYYNAASGWYAVLFYNKTLNQLQMMFDFGNGDSLFTVDDGWRTDTSENSYQVKVGADCAIGVDSVGSVFIAYQDMTNNKLMAFSGSFATGSAPTTPDDPKELYGMSSELDANGNAMEHGLAFGYYLTIRMMDGVVPLLGSYSFDMNSRSKSMTFNLDNMLTAK